MIQIRWRKVKLSLSGRKPMSPKVRAIQIENLRYLMDFSINETPQKNKEYLYHLRPPRTRKSVFLKSFRVFFSLSIKSFIFLIE